MRCFVAAKLVTNVAKRYVIVLCGRNFFRPAQPDSLFLQVSGGDKDFKINEICYYAKTSILLPDSSRYFWKSVNFQDFKSEFLFFYEGWQEVYLKTANIYVVVIFLPHKEIFAGRKSFSVFIFASNKLHAQFSTFPTHFFKYIACISPICAFINTVQRARLSIPLRWLMSREPNKRLWEAKFSSFSSFLPVPAVLVKLLCQHWIPIGESSICLPSTVPDGRSSSSKSCFRVNGV